MSQQSKNFGDFKDRLTFYAMGFFSLATKELILWAELRPLGRLGDVRGGDEIPDREVAAVRDAHDVRGELRVEARHRAVAVRQRVADDQRDRQRRRAVDQGDGLAADIHRGEHLLGVADDGVVLRRAPEPDLEEVGGAGGGGGGGAADVVRGHCCLLSM